MATTIAEVIEGLQARNFFGIASAAKRGRNPKFPYVPVVKLTDANGQASNGLSQTKQLKGLAYVTREEAVAATQRNIDRAYARLAEELGQPHKRALREWHGLPRELDEATV
jgi:hypothetical protein